MSRAGVSITLSEWQTLSPENCPDLAGLAIDGSPESRRVAELLNNSRMLRLTELRTGLEVAAASHVGRVRIGDLSITVLPKLKSSSLLRLLRYAFGFRNLELLSDSTHLVEQSGFEDILVSQLNAEAQELISRGLQRAYVRHEERLASPRGRIDIARIALDGGTVTAALPCRYFPRLEDTLQNRILLAGLRLAGSVASLLDLRRESLRLASLMEEQVSPIRLNAQNLEKADRHLTRLTSAYGPSLAIIRLLVEAQGIVLEGRATPTRLPGFLFDMNAFFQALMSRFLREGLDGFTVRDEHGLRGMMRYDPRFNPRRRQSPTPRPDYAVMCGGSLAALLDAKYRDLWEKPLPREMLYQLVVYAVSNPRLPQSSILYPTIDPLAREARIDVSDPLYGNPVGQVCLRPVDLGRLAALVASRTAAAVRERQQMARRLAFGEGCPVPC